MRKKERERDVGKKKSIDTQKRTRDMETYKRKCMKKRERNTLSE